MGQQWGGVGSMGGNYLGSGDDYQGVQASRSKASEYAGRSAFDAPLQGSELKAYQAANPIYQGRKAPGSYQAPTDVAAWNQNYGYSGVAGPSAGTAPQASTELAQTNTYGTKDAFSGYAGIDTYDRGRVAVQASPVASAFSAAPQAINAASKPEPATMAVTGSFGGIAQPQPQPQPQSQQANPYGSAVMIGGGGTGSSTSTLQPQGVYQTDDTAQPSWQTAATTQPQSGAAATTQGDTGTGSEWAKQWTGGRGVMPPPQAPQPPSSYPQAPQAPAYTPPNYQRTDFSQGQPSTSPADQISWAQQAGGGDMFKTPGWQYGLAGAGNIQKSVQGYDLNRQYIDPARMPVGSVGMGDPYIQKMEDAYYKQAQSRLDPQWSQRQQDMEAQLQNMGLNRGTEAWQREMDNFSRQRNDAYGSMTNQAILNSGQEAQRLQGMNIAGGNFANQAAQQYYQNQLTSQGAFNQAQQGQFSQGLQQGQFANAAQRQQFQELLDRGNFNNQALGTQGQLANQLAGIRSQENLGMAGLQNQANIANAQNQLGYAGLGNQLALGQMQNQLGYAGLENQMGIAGMNNQLGYAGLQNQEKIANIGANASMSNAGTAASASRANAQLAAALQQQLQEFNMSRQAAFDPYLMERYGLENQNLYMQGMYPTGVASQSPYVTPGGGAQYANMNNQGIQGQYQGWGQAAGALGGYLLAPGARTGSGGAAP